MDVADHGVDGGDEIRAVRNGDHRAVVARANSDGVAAGGRAQLVENLSDEIELVHPPRRSGSRRRWDRPSRTPLTYL